MSAARQMRVPSCHALSPFHDALRPRGRHSKAWIAVLVATLLAPSAAEAQDPSVAQRLRARGLSIIEGVLTDTINDSILVAVETVNAENLQAQEQSRAAGQVPELRYVIRSSGQTRARGMFLEDYGVIFTVQMPNLTYTHSALAQYSQSDSFIVSPNRPGLYMAGNVAQEAQLRNQMSRMGAEIDSLTARLENEVAASGATSENAQRLRELIGEIHTVYDDYSVEAERVAAARLRAETIAEAGGDHEDTWRGTFNAMWSNDPEAVARAQELALLQKKHVESAVIDAVVESLTYGHIFSGLNDDDRLAVVLLPSSYLNQVVQWMRATQRAEEYVISVRYSDVQGLASNEITPEEFGSRLRVESRSGQPPSR